MNELYGTNNTEIPKKSVLKIFIEEILSPFYLFQLFSIALWFYMNYLYYAIFITISSMISATVNLYDANQNYERLRKLSYYESDVDVFREVQNALFS